MRVLIFGAGALGGVMGVLLSRAHDVILITRGDHLSEIQRRGLRLEGLMNGCFKIPALEVIEDSRQFDAIFVTTKSYDTEIAAKCTVRHLVRNGCVVTVQNGIGNAETLGKYYDRSAVVIGVTSLAAHRVGPGFIRYVAEGEIAIGSLAQESAALDVAERILHDAGVRTRSTENITGIVWSKAIVNAAINPLTAIHRCRNGMIVDDKKLNEQAIAVCLEGSRVAEGMGIALDPPDVVRYMTDVATKTADNRSSMLSDIERGKRTEIDAICGPILRFGAKLGIECPVMSRLYHEIKSLERNNLRE
ncbi:MAG: 2-dehydropantoate 2-reductase [Thermoplasmata archaeon]